MNQVGLARGIAKAEKSAQGHGRRRCFEVDRRADDLGGAIVKFRGYAGIAAQGKDLVRHAHAGTHRGELAYDLLDAAEGVGIIGLEDVQDAYR